MCVCVCVFVCILSSHPMPKRLETWCKTHSKQMVMAVSVQMCLHVCVYVCVLTPHTMLFLLLGKKGSPQQQSPTAAQPARASLLALRTDRTHSLLNWWMPSEPPSTGRQELF